MIVAIRSFKQLVSYMEVHCHRQDATKLKSSPQLVLWNSDQEEFGKFWTIVYFATQGVLIRNLQSFCWEDTFKNCTISRAVGISSTISLNTRYNPRYYGLSSADVKPEMLSSSKFTKLWYIQGLCTLSKFLKYFSTWYWIHPFSWFLVLFHITGFFGQRTGIYFCLSMQRTDAYLQVKWWTDTNNSVYLSRVWWKLISCICVLVDDFEGVSPTWFA